MAISAPIQKPQSKTLEQRSKATIAALAPLFTTTAGQPAITPPHTLWSAIQTAYATALTTFSLPQGAHTPLSNPSTSTSLTNAIFTTDAKLFFQGPLFASLAPAAKARLLAQAIAGIVLFFTQLGESLGDGERVSERLLARELEVFRGGVEREAALDWVEESRVWQKGGREEVVRDLGRVVDWAGDEAEVEGLVGGGAMGVEVERPRNMGLPWGFSILPVN